MEQPFRIYAGNLFEELCDIRRPKPQVIGVGFVIVVVVVANFQYDTDGMLSPKFSKFCPVISAHVAVAKEDPCALVLF